MQSTQARKWALPPGTTKRHQWHKTTAKALSRLNTMTQERVELVGVIGGEERSSIHWVMCGDKTPAIAAILDALGEKHDYQITRDNADQVLSDARQAIKTAEGLRPIDDKRQTPEESNNLAQERNARDDERREKQRLAEESHKIILAKKPASAQALIVAEYQEDDSDSMTDYFNSITVRRVAIGWRTGKREDFKQLRRAAGASGCRQAQEKATI